MSAIVRVRRVGLLVVAVCGITGAVACKENKEPPVGPPGPVDTAEQVGFGVRTLLTANGVQRGELQADTMFVYNDQTKFDFRNARVKFNQLANEVTSDTTFVLKAGDREQRGIGFTADPNLTHFKCLRMCGGSAPITLPGT